MAEKDPFFDDLADVVSRMTFDELDQFITAMFAKSETLPYTFNIAIQSNLKSRKGCDKNGMLHMLRPN